MAKKIFYTSVFACIVLIILRSEYIMHYARNALLMCYEFIIPSLFPFFVCSGLLIYSGFGSVLAKASEFFMKPVFNIAPAGAAAFVLGIISGFPLGAVTAVQLYECGAISKSETERLLSFCCNSGPLFLIGTVGTALYGKISYGIIIYIIHILSSVIVGILFGFYGRNKHSAPKKKLKTNEISLSEVFVNSLSDASKNILMVCFSIIFFASISQTVISLFHLSPVIDAIASGLCEFSTGTLKISLLDISLLKKLILTSFIIGFSGISIHIQVTAITAKAHLSLVPYILGKFLHGIISAAFTAVILVISPIHAYVFASNDKILSVSLAIIPLMIIALTVIIFFINVILKINTIISHKKKETRKQSVLLT